VARREAGGYGGGMIERMRKQAGRLRTGWWLVAITLGVLCSCAKEEPAGPMTWLTDYPKALEQAKAEKKLVMLDFTGSDWCQPCMVLKRNVLGTKKFKEYADKKLVLVEVDFPNNIEQAPALKKTNRELAAKFDIIGYPTIVLVDADGKELLKNDELSRASVGEFIAALDKAAGK
jgi:thiol:disulfide interchange protein